ncbi:taurine ABC transporter substrate-binding protein [Bifidobacterium subtile]|jgi:taurine transport system substrate-binding protein|uniref:ABC transporter substrate-binding protein n=1 Tax=Bifidobacterium subtile TaxID=77635 RepID=A0A087E9M3_9BIFI|nr:ABC transporter substrate-binding protein [Bifidobacterium subtile]KFJ04474.1 ABC transporter substrate-binding protein [Bifidobacterium subtile]MCI1223609.1 ABC transporter substrate-binding protein [Bifidobacterium subtile]MCI1242102.1 ABC transporter substrate-binding protein [Bifidobacterium subtile]MCI1258841.1 ABC transporter substrate-binding protein [Bifidobacterium subtile]
MKRKTILFANSRSAWIKGIAVAVSAMLVGSLGACGAMQKADQLSGASNASSEKCPVTVNKEAKGTIRIAWQAIANADLVVKDRKLLEACIPNATIQWNQFNSGGDVVQAFGSRSVDIGLAGSSPAVKSVSAPLNLKVKVLWIHDIIGEAESLVAHNSSAKSIKDLAGKNIAVPFGSTSHFSLLSALSQAGMDSSSVHLINLDPDKMAAAWGRGEIDAAWVWDPVLSKLKADGGSVVTSSAATAKNGAATFDMELVSDDFIKANPSAVETWTAVENYAIGLIASDPDNAADSISAQLGNSPKDVKVQFKGYSYPDAAEQSKIFSDQLPGIFKATAQFLKGQGDLDAVNADYAPALYTTAIDAVAKQ